MTSLMLMGVCLIISPACAGSGAHVVLGTAGGLESVQHQHGACATAIVPNHLLSRVLSIAAALGWSAITQALVGGWRSAPRERQAHLRIIGVLTSRSPRSSVSSLGDA
jgi:hypothetical protein